MPIPRPATLPATEADLFAVLDGLGIRHQTFRHAPVATVEQANAVWAGIPGQHCKNLFLKDAKGRMWLVVVPADMRVDLKALPDKIGSARLSFGSADRLVATLGVPPGSVTPFALINDPGHRVRVVLDAHMMDQPLVAYHPLHNGATTVISADDLRAFVRWAGHDWEVVRL
jgi:Ala-tRNA(Pro) deacylase